MRGLPCQAALSASNSSIFFSRMTLRFFTSTLTVRSCSAGVSSCQFVIREMVLLCQPQPFAFLVGRQC